MTPYKDFFKRAIDIVVSGGTLLVLALPEAAVSIWLHFANKEAGAFFYHERPASMANYQSGQIQDHDRRTQRKR